MKNHLYYLLLLIFGLSAHAQQVQIKVLNPLKKEQKIGVYSLYKSQQGWLWIGTNSGLFRYNGSNFKNYNENDSLNSKPIKALTEWHNQLWIAHQKDESHTAIEIMNPHGKITKFNPKEGLPEEDVEKLLPLNDSILLIATNGEGLYFYNRNIDRLYNISDADGLNDVNCYDLLTLGDNKVLVSSDGGLAAIEFLPQNKYKIKTYSLKEGLLDDLTRVLVRDQYDNIWVSTESLGMVFFDYQNEKFTYFNEFKENKIGEVYDAVSFENEMWLATRKMGLLRWKSKEKKFIPATETQNEWFLCLLKDETDMVWVGSNQNLYQSPGSRFESFVKIPDLEDILLDTVQDILYYSTKTGLFSMDIKTGSVYQFKGVNFSINTLYQDEFGYIWGGSLGTGLCRVNPTNKSVFIFKDEISKNSISHITGRKGEIWISTYNGVFYAKNTDNKNFTEKFKRFYDKKLTGEYVFKTFFDKQDGIWFCSSDRSLTCFKSDKFTSFRDSLGASVDVHAMLQAKNGHIWLATEKGTWKYDGKKFYNYPILENNDEEFIFSLAEDKYGRILALRQNNIDLYLPDSIFPIHFSKEDGFEDLHFGSNTNAVETGKNGQLWIAHSEGILIYHPSKNLRPLSPSVVIYDVLVFLKDHHSPSKSTFKHNQNHLTFNFDAFWYAAPEKISYEYMIENYDITWNLTNKPLVTYAGLPPGEYIFKVRATQGSLFDISPVTEYPFTISYPIWQRWWFILLVAIFIFILVRAIVSLRTKSLLEAKRELETKVQERTAEISAQKEEILMQRDKLQEAMEQLAVKSSDLEKAFVVIDKKNKDITSSINYAKRIQNAFLPSHTQLQALLGNYFLIYYPRDIVSGDFYWVFQNSKNDVYVAVVDCTGHGVPGAFMSLIGNSILNSIISRFPDADPNFILDEMDKGVKAFLNQEENKTRDGMDAAICKINKQEGTLKTAAAQRPIYLVKAQNSELIQIEGTSQPIGGFKERQGGYTINEYQINSGDKIYLFSDGMPDQFGGDKNRKFMIKHFRTLIEKTITLPMSQQGKVIEDTLIQWQGQHRQTDDWLTIGIEI